MSARSARRIVLAHADEGQARELSLRLATLGHEIAAVVGSTEEAVDLPATSTADLLLLDADLATDPGGRRWLDALRVVRQLPILFLVTDETLPALVGAGLRAHDGVVAVPCADRELRVAIETTLLRREAARDAQALDERFFAISIDMLCFLGFDGYFRRLNPAWERTLGWSVDELTSRPFIEFVHPDDRERTLAQNAAVRGGGRALGFENRYLCKDGSFRWFLWNAAPGPEERVIYSVARDITARKEAETERERLVGELQAALAEVKVLQEILPICSYCRKVRDDENYWQTVESYISRHTNAQFSHGICPSCMETIVEPGIAEFERE